VGMACLGFARAQRLLCVLVVKQQMSKFYLPILSTEDFFTYNRASFLVDVAFSAELCRCTMLSSLLV